MSNIVLARIDDRLIHGQVVATWASYLGINLIIVVDDEVAQDRTQQILLDLAVPSGILTRYFTIEEVIKKINKLDHNYKIFIIVRNVNVIVKLVESGVPIKKVNVGNMHFKDGKKQISPAVFVDDNDIEVFRKLSDLGVRCEIKRVPSERGIDIMELI